jgi:hypothetical protein
MAVLLLFGVVSFKTGASAARISDVWEGKIKIIDSEIEAIERNTNHLPCNLLL